MYATNILRLLDEWGYGFHLLETIIILIIYALFIYKETPLQYFCFVYILTYVLVDDGKLSNIVKLNCVNARKSLQLRIRCKMKKKIQIHFICIWKISEIYENILSHRYKWIYTNLLICWETNTRNDTDHDTI